LCTHSCDNFSTEIEFWHFNTARGMTDSDNVILVLGKARRTVPMQFKLCRTPGSAQCICL